MCNIFHLCYSVEILVLTAGVTFLALLPGCSAPVFGTMTFTRAHSIHRELHRRVAADLSSLRSAEFSNVPLTYAALKRRHAANITLCHKQRESYPRAARGGSSGPDDESDEPDATPAAACQTPAEATQEHTPDAPGITMVAYKQEYLHHQVLQDWRTTGVPSDASNIICGHDNKTAEKPKVHFYACYLVNMHLFMLILSLE